MVGAGVTSTGASVKTIGTGVTMVNGGGVLLCGWGVTNIGCNVTIGRLLCGAEVVAKGEGVFIPEGVGVCIGGDVIGVGLAGLSVDNGFRGSIIPHKIPPPKESYKTMARCSFLNLSYPFPPLYISTIELLKPNESDKYLAVTNGSPVVHGILDEL